MSSTFDKYVKEESNQEKRQKIYTLLRTSVCTETFNRFVDLADEQAKLNPSNLIAILLDKAMSEGISAFKYPIELPSDEYIENKYVNEAKRIIDFINDFEKGIMLRNLILCRRQMGIDDKTHMLYAIREVLEKGMAYLVYKTAKSSRKKDKKRLMIRSINHYTGKNPDQRTKNYKKIIGKENENNS